MNNPDRALVAQFLSSGRAPLAIASNPLARDLGGTLIELDGTRGEALVAFEPGAQHLQGAGVIQGGISATLLDFAMAFAGHAKLEACGTAAGLATATLTVQFLSAAPPGRYLARGRIVRQGSRLMFAESSLSAAEDARLIATATAVLALTEVPKR